MGITLVLGGLLIVAVALFGWPGAIAWGGGVVVLMGLWIVADSR